MVNWVSPKFLTAFLTIKGRIQEARRSFCHFYLSEVPKLWQLTHFSWGNIWFESFALCKIIDLLQLPPVYVEENVLLQQSVRGIFWTDLLWVGPISSPQTLYLRILLFMMYRQFISKINLGPLFIYSYSSFQ